MSLERDNDFFTPRAGTMIRVCKKKLLEAGFLKLRSENWWRACPTLDLFYPILFLSVPQPNMLSTCSCLTIPGAARGKNYSPSCSVQEVRVQVQREAGHPQQHVVDPHNTPQQLLMKGDPGLREVRPRKNWQTICAPEHSR